MTKDPADDFNESEERWRQAFALRYYIDKFLEVLDSLAPEEK